MGQRTVEVPDQPDEDQGPRIEVPIGKLLATARNRAQALQDRVDFLEVALGDSMEREQQMLARIAELEDKPNG